MTPDQLQRGVFWFIVASGGAAFVGCFLLLAIQPRRQFRWFGLCFGWLWTCFGSVFLMGAWQQAIKGGAWDWHDWRVLPGAGLACLGAVIASGLWFMDKTAAEPDEPGPMDEGMLRCTQHARRINLLSLLGVVLSVATFFGLFRTFVATGLSEWAFPLVFVLGQLPALVVGFVFPPQCPSCKARRMKLMMQRRASYCCPACGHVELTDIEIASRRHHPGS
jgi:predicted RNA-binding Zn-ribbon protein involved in translation (DUF1610 family)